MPRQDGAVPLWFYAGAALGPFAGGVIGVVIPALRGEFAADLGALSWAVPAYMIPFAGFQLVSALCGLAPSISWFLAGRFGQGSANAFTTAVLTAALADLVPRERLGRAIGVFSSVNVAGSFAAPMVGGLLASLDWRLIYGLVALLAAGLWLLYDRWLRRLPRRSNVVMPSPRQLAAS